MEATIQSPVVTDYNTKLQRLEIVKQDPQTMNVIAQRVADGETLREIAGIWEIPFGGLQLWIMSDRERFELYENALKARADEEVHQAIKISDDEYCRNDDGTVMKNSDGMPILKDTTRSRLQVKTRLSVAKMWDAKRFGIQAAKEERKVPTGTAGIGEVVKVLSEAFRQMDLKKSGETVDAEIVKEVKI